MLFWKVTLWIGESHWQVRDCAACGGSSIFVLDETVKDVGALTSAIGWQISCGCALARGQVPWLSWA
jgi:uncharacterized Zn-binding protein involved in type VI secretion